MSRTETETQTNRRSYLKSVGAVSAVGMVGLSGCSGSGNDTTGTLDGGEEATVETPGNAPLQFNEEFEIRDGETTTFLGDFTPVKRGQTNGYLLQPVASGTEVRYEEA